MYVPTMHTFLRLSISLFVKNLPLDLSAVKPMLDRKDAAKLDERNLYK